MTIDAELIPCCEKLDGSTLKIVPSYTEAGYFCEANCVTIEDKDGRKMLYVPLDEKAKGALRDFLKVPLVQLRKKLDLVIKDLNDGEYWRFYTHVIRPQIEYLEEGGIRPIDYINAKDEIASARPRENVKWENSEVPPDTQTQEKK